MTEYKIEGTRYLLHDGKLFVEVTPSEQRETATEMTAVPEKPSRGREAKRPGKKQYSCRVCGKPGHRAKTCPKASGTDVETAESEMTDAEIEAKVHGLQNEGKGSLSVARELRIPLAKVNQFWQRTCGRCDKPGHEYPNCPDLPKEQPGGDDDG